MSSRRPPVDVKPEDVEELPGTNARGDGPSEALALASDCSHTTPIPKLQANLPLPPHVVSSNVPNQKSHAEPKLKAAGGQADKE